MRLSGSVVCTSESSFKDHESIICLPNKVVVEVDGSEESEFDAVAN